MSCLFRGVSRSIVHRVPRNHPELRLQAREQLNVLHLRARHVGGRRRWITRQVGDATWKHFVYGIVIHLCVLSHLARYRPHVCRALIRYITIV